MQTTLMIKRFLRIQRPLAQSLLYSLEQAAGAIDLYVNVNKTELMCLQQERAISE